MILAKQKEGLLAIHGCVETYNIIFFDVRQGVRALIHCPDDHRDWNGSAMHLHIQ